MQHFPILTATATLSSNPGSFFNMLTKSGACLAIDIAGAKDSKKSVIFAHAERVRIDHKSTKLVETVELGIRGGRPTIGPSRMMAPNQSRMSNLFAQLKPEQLVLFTYKEQHYYAFTKDTNGVTIMRSVNETAPITIENFTADLEGSLAGATKVEPIKVLTQDGFVNIYVYQSNEELDTAPVDVQKVTFRRVAENKLHVGNKKLQEFLSAVSAGNGYGIVHVDNQPKFVVVPEGREISGLNEQVNLLSMVTAAFPPSKTDVTNSSDTLDVPALVRTIADALTLDQVAAPNVETQEAPQEQVVAEADKTEDIAPSDVVTAVLDQPKIDTEQVPEAVFADVSAEVTATVKTPAVREVNGTRGIQLSSLNEYLGAYSNSRLEDLRMKHIDFNPVINGVATHLGLALTHRQQTVGLVMPWVRFSTGALNGFSRKEKEFTDFVRDLKFIKTGKIPEITTISRAHEKALIFINAPALLQLQEKGYLDNLPKEIADNLAAFMKIKTKTAQTFSTAAKKTVRASVVPAKTPAVKPIDPPAAAVVVAAPAPSHVVETPPVQAPLAVTQPVPVQAVAAPRKAATVAVVAAGQAVINTASPELKSFMLLGQIISSALEEERVVVDQADGNDVHFLKIPALKNDFQDVVEFHNYIDQEKQIALNAIVLPSRDKAGRMNGLKSIFTAIADDKNIVSISDEATGASFLATKNASFVQTMQEFQVLKA